jgi:enoyl-CoA hydratase
MATEPATTSSPNGTAARLESYAFTTLAIRRETPAVAVASLDRPDQLNAMTREMFDELQALAVLAEADHALRCLVITGRGRGFCAGGDYEVLGSLTQQDTAQRYGALTAAARAIPAIHRLPVTTIAAINGPAAGGGLALALACDLRIAAADAVFVAPFLERGISACDVGISWLLPRVLGLGRAAELMLTARRVDAEEAERTGLVSRVVPPKELLDSALETAGEVARFDPLAVRLTKEGLHLAADAPSLEAAMAIENRNQALTLGALR